MVRGEIPSAPTMNTDDLRATYDRIAQDYYQDHKDDPWNSRFTKLFSESLFPGAKVLDLGCGPGIETEKLVGKGFKVHGLDLSPGLLEIARKRIPDAVFTEANILEPLPYESDFFDGIFCKAALLHIPHKEIEPVLQEIRRILKDKGVLYISVKKGSGEKIIQENDYGYAYERFFSFWESKELEPIFEKFHFSVIEKSQDSHQTYNTHTWLKYLLKKQ